MPRETAPRSGSTAPPKRKRILVLTADAGFGHRAAANAIVQAVQERYGDRCDAIIANPLDDAGAPALLKRAQDDYDRVIRESPDLYRLGYEASGGSLPTGIAEQALSLMLYATLRETLLQQKPDAIVSTYPLYLAPLATLCLLTRRCIPVLTVVTDLVSVHRLWFNDDVTKVLVPTQAVMDRALESGLARDQVEITGLPVNPSMAHPADRALLRAQLGWSTDRFVALCTGSKRVTKLEPVLRILNHMGLPLELAMVTGGDDALRRRLEAETWHVPAHVYGYVENMAELMKAADFIVCKAGGLVVSEALAAGLPLLLAEALPGQETGNAAFVEEGRAGVLIDEPLDVLETVFHWLDQDAALLRKTAERARSLGRPGAAFRVAELAWEAAQVGPAEIPERGLAPAFAQLKELLLGPDSGKKGVVEP
jgi:1,2-diacylglycerol 3-beta-galactosyltransferase